MLAIASRVAGRTSVLRKRRREDKDRTEWALMDSKGEKVLKWFGPEKPSDERVKKEERRIQYFKHQGCLSLSFSRVLRRGSLPSKGEFLMAFELGVPGGLYPVRGPRGESSYPVPDGDYGPDELWAILKKLVSSGPYVAAAILQTLGFDWS